MKSTIILLLTLLVAGCHDRHPETVRAYELAEQFKPGDVVAIPSLGFTGVVQLADGLFGVRLYYKDSSNNIQEKTVSPEVLQKVK